MRWKRTIYCSHATVPVENSLNLAELLGVSARNNQRDDITGALVFVDGMFMQALEGREHMVDGLMSRLHADTRHRDMKVLGEDFAFERAFPVWVMETPKLSPSRTDLLRKLIGGCERSYDQAFGMMAELVREQVDQRQWG